MPDLLRPFLKIIKNRYEAIMVSTKVTKMRATVPGIEVSFEGDKAPSIGVYDRVLVAIGRRANGGTLDAEKAGVAVDQRGIIAVDKQMRTNVPHIFAIGDLAGGPMLAHKATHEAKVAAEVIAGEKSYFDARSIPSVGVAFCMQPVYLALLQCAATGNADVTGSAARRDTGWDWCRRWTRLEP